MEIIALLWKVAASTKDNIHKSLGQGLQAVMKVYLFVTAVKPDLICRICCCLFPPADGLSPLGKKKRALQSPGVSHVAV